MPWNDDEHTSVLWTVNNVLANEDAGLDRLSESDFIGEEVAFDGICEYAANSRYLVGKQFDRGGSQAGKTPECRTLTREIPNNVRTTIEEERSICDSISEVVCGILDGVCPAEVEPRDRDADLI